MEMIDNVPTSMARYTKSAHLAMLNINLAIGLYWAVDGFDERGIMSTTDNFKVVVGEVVVEILCAASMIPMLMCVQDMTDLRFGEICMEEMEDDMRVGGIN